MKTKEAVTIIVFVTALACTFQTSFAAVNGMSCNATSDCTEYAQCSSSVCQCMSGYKDSGSDTCILVYNSTCAADDGCSNLPDSVCTGPTDAKQCKCKSGYKYVEATLTCVKVLGEGCTESVECTMTVNNSQCAGDPKVCSCMSGYTEISDLCAEVFQISCDNNQTCTDVLAYTMCSAGKCACATGYVAENKICKEVSSSVLWQPSCLLVAIATLMVILGIEI